ncbi:MAG: hypothetical protein WCY21_06775 [Candidatus Cloacimonadaceae bacterium]|jgi:hypothetical protein|nr:hypothetical protein [Candidatus Cloacimonadota bacterium]MDX9950020.1 hypothetical protein [Candidatus Syntrophosphaera sp.]NLN84540.1 hypothetical protein [Candidatus Cloacimonadota bacterium]
MKKLIYTLLALALTAVLGAQTGLFNLSFDIEADEAIEILEASGFEIIDETSDRIRFSDSENPYVDEIWLYFAGDDSLESWTIFYLPQDDEDIEDLVMDALIERHGTDFAVDFIYEEFYWDLDEFHSVSASWWGDALFNVEYRHNY